MPDDTMTTMLDQLLDELADRVAARLQGSKDTWTVPELAQRYGVSRTTIQRRIREGAFGDTISIGERKRVVTAEGLSQYDATHCGQAYKPQTTKRRYKQHRPDPGPI